MMLRRRVREPRDGENPSLKRDGNKSRHWSFHAFSLNRANRQARARVNTRGRGWRWDRPTRRPARESEAIPSPFARLGAPGNAGPRRTRRTPRTRSSNPGASEDAAIKMRGKWTLGDGQTSAGQNSIHEFKNAGNFTTIVHIESPEGGCCRSTVRDISLT
jgi:hypothetical protein